MAKGLPRFLNHTTTGNIRGICPNRFSGEPAIYTKDYLHTKDNEVRAQKAAFKLILAEWGPFSEGIVSGRIDLRKLPNKFEPRYNSKEERWELTYMHNGRQRSFGAKVSVHGYKGAKMKIWEKMLTHFSKDLDILAWRKVFTKANMIECKSLLLPEQYDRLVNISNM